MARLLKTRSRVFGLHPGSLVYVGQTGSVEKIHINLINYTQDSFFESESSDLDKCVTSAKDKSHITWIEFEGVLNKTIIEDIGNHFGIHRLWLEDVLNTDHRPKVEAMDDMLFSIIKFVSIQKHKGRLRLSAAQTSIFFKDGFVLSFQNKKTDIFEPVKERIRNSVWKIRTLKADYLFYSLIDMLVDQYYIVLEQMGDYFEEMETRVTESINKFNPADIISLKGEFLYLRRMIFPVKEAVNKITISRHKSIDPKNFKYFQDVHDHIVQIIEITDHYNELTTSLMDFYQNDINRKMNEIMKVLTIFASIFIPLTFVVGIYGMNFKAMPELDWKYGYLSVWGIIAIIGTSMILFFKKKNWL